jgi:type IV fimbrial biogenesis protein FimT
MLKPRDQRGFTLIELLVGIVIMAALAMLAGPNFATWLQNTQIRTAAEAVQNGVHLARAEAVRRNTPVIFQLTSTLDNTCTLSTAGKNWVVSLDAATSSCGSAPTADLAVPVAPRIIQTRAGSDGSKNAVVSAGQSSITFNGLGRVTPVPAGNIAIDISNPTGGTCAASSGPMRCMRVVVSTSGQVRLCDPRLASSDPQGC